MSDHDSWNTDQPSHYTYNIGYRKPPKATRFKPGQSGNPGGRRRASMSDRSSAFQTLLDREIAISTGDRTETRSLEEALQLRTYQEALKGKAMAIREVIGWILKREAWLAKHQPQQRRSVIFGGTRQDPDNADEVLLLLNIAGINPARHHLNATRRQLLLEPWVVTAALKKRGLAGSLETRQVENIRRCTRDDGSIMWPARVAP